MQTILTRGSFAAVVVALSAATASAHISGITSTDNSSGVFDVATHQTSVGPVGVAGNAVSFTHTTQLVNTAAFTGGVVQTSVGNSSFQLAFTVEDPGNVGFEISLDQLLRGYSGVDVQVGQGNATGVSYFVQFDDSTDAPDTFSNFVPAFIGTSGVGLTVPDGSEPDSARDFFEAIDSDVLGSYVGTTDFVLDFTTGFSPTTNVFFQNGGVGSGEINYGLGTSQIGDDFTADELGHFLTVTATFVPEPASLGLLGVLGLGLLRRR
ncbi:MAG: PEP-CTERM sorting domain-containing protein [Planctomycetota bacterium]